MVRVGKRRRLTIRRLMVWVAVIAILLAIVPPVVLFIDAGSHGPYACWYNAHMQRLSDEAGLVGRPEADIVRVLGKPSYTYGSSTYNYCPCPFSPYGKFQVHCEGGTVIGVEQHDY